MITEEVSIPADPTARQAPCRSGVPAAMSLGTEGRELHLLFTRPSLGFLLICPGIGERLFDTIVEKTRRSCRKRRGETQAVISNYL